MKKVFYSSLCSIVLLACNQPKQEQQQETTPVVETKQQPVEFADPKYVAIGKEGIAAFASGDVETWMKAFADNAIYSWSSGDSLKGKKAISEYWTERRGKVIDKMIISKDSWLAVNVKDPKIKEYAPGVWLLSWYHVEPTYKNGTSIKFWVHTLIHFDANDKIDNVIQYIDRAPIAAALAKKK